MTRFFGKKTSSFLLFIFFSASGVGLGQEPRCMQNQDRAKRCDQELRLNKNQSLGLALGLFFDMCIKQFLVRRLGKEQYQHNQLR